MGRKFFINNISVGGYWVFFRFFFIGYLGDRFVFVVV